MSIARFQWNPQAPTDAQIKAGLRFGDKGTHTSRTMMLAEITDAIAAVPTRGDRGDYATAIVEDNVLGKHTASTQRLTNQRLGELYGLDRAISLFRVVRRLWDVDERGRPLLALLCALGRDPLLRSSAAAILDLPVGAELVRTSFLGAIRHGVGDRLNESILDKVARNAASSWTQSGHLDGRVRKKRTRVDPTPGSLAFALWLGQLEGLAGEQLLDCSWARVLDRRGPELVPVALQAKQMGLIHARIGGGVVELDTSRLDIDTMELWHGQD